MPMLKDARKPAATLIVRRINGLMGDSDMTPEAFKETNESGDEISRMGLDAAAEDVIAAMKEESPEMFKASMMAFIEMALQELERSEIE